MGADEGGDWSSMQKWWGHKQGTTYSRLLMGEIHEWIKYTHEWDRSKDCVGMRLYNWRWSKGIN